MQNTHPKTVVVAFFAILALLSLSASAQQDKNIQKSPLIPAVTVSAFYYDGYLANRINRLLTPESTVWYQLGLKWSSGLYFNWLEIHGVDDFDWSSGATDETQVALGYAWKVGKYDLKCEATVINIHPLEDWLEHDRLSLDLYVSRAFKFDLSGKHTLTPELRVIWFSDTNALDKGVPIIIPSVIDQWDKLFGVDFLSLHTRLAICWDGGLYKNSSRGIFLQAETGLQWKLGENTTLTLPGYKVLAPLTNPKDGRDSTHGLFFAGVRHRF